MFDPEKRMKQKAPGVRTTLAFPVHTTNLPASGVYVKTLAMSSCPNEVLCDYRQALPIARIRGGAVDIAWVFG